MIANEDMKVEEAIGGAESRRAREDAVGDAMDGAEVESAEGGRSEAGP